MSFKNVLFAFALMSVLASGVNAQTSKTKIEASDSAKIMAALPTAELTEDDKLVVEELLRNGNSLNGGIAEDGAVISIAKYGDEWKAYISCREGSWYLTYEVFSPKGQRRGTAYIKIG